MRDISVLYLTNFTILGCTFWGKKPSSNKKKLDLQSAGSSPNLIYTKISARDAIRISFYFKGVGLGHLL